MRTISLAAALALATPALAADPSALLAGYRAHARETNAAFDPSAQRGARLFTDSHGNDWSCATCHGNPPDGPGRHATTGKTIAPLAPSANPERFTSDAKVEKWFRRNCNDVLGRACTAAEKADVLAYLLE